MATKANPVGWFEIPANDLSRAQAFYEHILGTQLSLHEVGPMKMAWFPMEQNAPGAAGSLVKAEGQSPSQTGTLIYFSVEDIEGVLKKANDKGGKTLHSKESIGEYGFIALIQDSEGNRIGIHSMK
jgi:predicted enzyme related to lactoylglutathione lyase